MKYFTIELNGEEINLRITSQDAVKLEKNNNVKLLDYIQDYSTTAITTLLRYMLQGGRDGKTVSSTEAELFLDQLIEDGWRYEKIITDIIMPTCEVSGFLSQSDLNLLKQKQDEAKQKASE